MRFVRRTVRWPAVKISESVHYLIEHQYKESIQQCPIKVLTQLSQKQFSERFGGSSPPPSFGRKS